VASAVEWSPICPAVNRRSANKVFETFFSAKVKLEPVWAMVPPTASPVLGPQPYQPTRDRVPWSCGRQYAWRPAQSGHSVSAKIQNLEKTIRKIDDALQNDLEALDDQQQPRSPGKIQYDKISVFPLNRGSALKDSRLSPRPLPRSSSFFSDRAKSVVNNVATTSTSTERACSAPPAPPRLQQFGRY
jgi:hypothetical protein